MDVAWMTSREQPTEKALKGAFVRSRHTSPSCMRPVFWRWYSTGIRYTRLGESYKTDIGEGGHNIQRRIPECIVGSPNFTTRLIHGIAVKP